MSTSPSGPVGWRLDRSFERLLIQAVRKRGVRQCEEPDVMRARRFEKRIRRGRRVRPVQDGSHRPIRLERIDRGIGVHCDGNRGELSQPPRQHLPLIGIVNQEKDPWTGLHRTISLFAMAYGMAGAYPRHVHDVAAT